MSAVRGGQKPSVVSIAGWRGGGCWVLGAGFWRRKLYAGFVAGEFGEGREFSSDCDQKPANLQNHPVSRQAGGPVRGTGRFWERTWVSRCCTIPVAPAAAHAVRPQLNHLLFDSLAIVAHRDFDAPIIFHQADRTIPCSGMPEHVGQGLLDNAEYGSFQFWLESIEIGGIDFQVNVDSTAF